jgi:hypothetical protein
MRRLGPFDAKRLTSVLERGDAGRSDQASPCRSPRRPSLPPGRRPHRRLAHSAQRPRKTQLKPDKLFALSFPYPLFQIQGSCQKLRNNAQAVGRSGGARRLGQHPASPFNWIGHVHVTALRFCVEACNSAMALRREYRPPGGLRGVRTFAFSHARAGHQPRARG